MSAPHPAATLAGRVAVPRERYPDLSPSAYALTVASDGMRPLLAAGDVLIIDPERPPQPGDRVVLYGAASVVDFTGSELGVVHAIVGVERRE